MVRPALRMRFPLFLAAAVSERGTMKRCAFCGGRLGLISHRKGRLRFCKRVHRLAYLQRQREKRAESTLEEAGAIAATTRNALGNQTTTKSFTVPITADVKVDTEAQIESAAPTVLDQEEIQRRRDLVRTLFNDFWSGAYEKPAAFVERLDQAEDYLNERLKANGEVWRLDATTRAMLGLPPRSSSPD
jgi:hypothetical protein